ncbi:MAG: M1 family aminopeptidase [Labilithrix sp.]
MRRLKMLSTYVYGLILFAAGFFMMLASGGAFSGVAVSSGNEKVNANSPQLLFGNISLIALFGIFTVAAIFGQAAYQDFGHGTWMIIFTKNVKKRPYLIGRFLGAFIFSALLFLTIGAGLGAASVVVWKMHPENLGHTMITAYLWPYLVEVWPMLFFTGALFFTLAAVTRKMAPVYVGAVVLVLGYVVATALLGDVANRSLAAMLDPFGFLAHGVTTRYWTPVEQNRDLVPVFSLFGANRLVWTAAGVGLLALAIARFRTTVDEQKGKSTDDAPSVAAVGPIPAYTTTSSALGWLRACGFLTSAYVREILRSAVFWSLITAGVLLGTVVVFVSKEIFGTATLPVTYQALELTSAGFKLFTVIIVIFYAGELVWRERDVGIQDVLDATRAPSWVGFVAKLLALLGVAFSIKLVVGLVALISQVGRGYFAIEPKLYLMELFVLGWTGTALTCVLALVVHVLVNHKYIAHSLMVLYYVFGAILAAVGVEEPLVRYGSDTSVQYSDMNGYGHFLDAFMWFRIYWWGFALMLLVLGYVAFVRGRETGLAARLRAGRRTRLTIPAILAAAIGMGAFAMAGGFIFWNTRILHPYETAKDSERDKAAYEKKFGAEKTKPQPSIIAFDGSFDVFPAERRWVSKGVYRLKNKTAQPISRVMLNVNDRARFAALTIAGVPATESDDRLGVKIFTLPAPIAAGEEAELAFDMSVSSVGFKHGAPETQVVENGTFVNNFALPIVGYFERAELAGDRDRKRYDLPAKERMASRDDVHAQQVNYLRQDGDFIDFKITVSTSPDQIAIAPGYLAREWTEGGRRYFRYEMDQPILNFFSVLSARYEVKKDVWHGAERDVNLEIYHHPTHTANLDRMMNGMKDSLSYCSEAFGPYQHRQARILEFPRYHTFAQSFPNTIPYSENVGFIARVRDSDPDDVDYPYYITAHEIAHQWWAHQVIGANVRGATMLSESLAQYSALMVMKKKYGADRMRRFLKFELDGYLRGRFTEQKKERPLAENENQMYIHYQKGSIALYALQDYIGEDHVNAALKSIVDKWKFQGPPYPTTKDLMAAFRAETPPEMGYLIEDLFETITLYDNRTKSATAKQSGNEWTVTLKYAAKKLRADAQGEQKEVDFDDLIDVGALDAEGNAIHVEKRRLKNGAGELTFKVDRKPIKVGIDPLNKLIDRDSSDNVTAPGGD